MVLAATFGVADAHGAADAQVPSDGQEALRWARDAARAAESEEGWSAARRRAAVAMDVRCALQHAVRVRARAFPPLRGRALTGDIRTGLGRRVRSTWVDPRAS